jgi:hypothetical protein
MLVHETSESISEQTGAAVVTLGGAAVVSGGAAAVVTSGAAVVSGGAAVVTPGLKLTSSIATSLKGPEAELRD